MLNRLGHAYKVISIYIACNPMLQRGLNESHVTTTPFDRSESILSYRDFLFQAQSILPLANLSISHLFVWYLLFNCIRSLNPGIKLARSSWQWVPLASLFGLLVCLLSTGSYRSANKALVACLSLSNVCLALQADIRADSSRNGKVDIFSNADLKHKLKWSNEEGAIFLANIGDTDRRCSKLALAGPPLSNEALAACNDASDDIQRSPKYLAPLQTVPLKDLSPEAWGTVAVHQEIARKNVRIFQQKNEDWVIMNNGHKLSQRELQDGLILGIDARDTRRPLGWDGRVEVHFHVQDGIHSSDDYVRLRVAPVLSYHHLQPAEEFITTAGNETDSPDQLHFVNNMTKAIRETGVDKPLFLFSHSDDVWSQDHLEPSYSSMPGPDGLITIQVMIRSSQPGRVAGRQVFEYLRKTDRGAMYTTGGTRDEVDSMGNLETIPPYTHRGKSYPAGRIIEGSHGKLNPQVYDYMRAQEVQDPLLLDADWLGVGHVDEFIQFMPSEKGLHGWVLFIADPISGLNILGQAEEDGHGEARAFSRSNATTLHPSPPDPYVPGYTISQLLSNKELVEDNNKFVKLIDAVRRFYKTKLVSQTRTSISFPPYSKRASAGDQMTALILSGIVARTMLLRCIQVS